MDKELEDQLVNPLLEAQTILTQATGAIRLGLNPADKINSCAADLTSVVIELDEAFGSGGEND